MSRKRLGRKGSRETGRKNSEREGRGEGVFRGKWRETRRKRIRGVNEGRR